MLRFFEPETEPPRWMVSAAPRDLRLPPLLHYPYESRVSGSAAVFPLLSSASGSRHGTSFENRDARPPTRNAFGNIRECCSFVYSEDCDSFQLQPSARPVPTNPLNCTPGIRSTFVNPEAANSGRSIGVGCTPNAMKGKRAGNSNIEKSDAIELDSKRQKATVCMASSDVPGRGKRSQKLGDRVTALQQLVSPFGKTDTASVLHEATIYIKTLHDQIQAFTGSHVGINSWLPLQQGHGRERLSLRQRGLCLVPVSQIIIDPTHRAPFDHCNMERTFNFP